MIGRNDPCWCGSGEKWKKCHFPDKGEDLAQKYLKQWRIRLKNGAEIEGIRRSGHLAAQILEETCRMAKRGVTTLELNDFAVKLHEEAGAIAAPLGYGHPPFPKSICTSLNDVICHGIPDRRELQDGDILNIDITCILDGYYGDCSKMVVIGDVDEEKRNLVDVAYGCLMRSIAVLKPGAPLCLIGNTIEEYANAHGCSVVNQFVGHGVGLEFHEPPQVFHYANNNATPLAPGMIFTIEPMINSGVREAVVDNIDMWTARTRDGKPSAQWEHTLLITDTGYEILTPWKR